MTRRDDTDAEAAAAERGGVKFALQPHHKLIAGVVIAVVLIACTADVIKAAIPRETSHRETTAHEQDIKLKHTSRGCCNGGGTTAAATTTTGGGIMTTTTTTSNSSTANETATWQRPAACEGDMVPRDKTCMEPLQQPQ